MPQTSSFQIPIPATDLLTYLFPDNVEPPNIPIWIDSVEPETKSLSPKQLIQWVKRVGLGLQNLGLKPGDVVMIYSMNHIYVPVAFLGILGSGCISSGCNPVYGEEEVAYQIRDTGAKVVLVDPSLLDVALRAVKKTNLSGVSLYLFSDSDCQTTNGITDWKNILASSEVAAQWHWRILGPKESKTEIATINYSSGTTGLPKGVMISHQNIIANVEQSIYMRDLEQPYDPSSRPPERWLGFLPIYHGSGQLWSVSGACKTLSKCFFMKSFSYPEFLQNIQAHKITHIQSVPPILVMLAKRPETEKYDLSSLQNILCGAAPLSKDLQNEVSDRFNVNVVQTWGMTELTCSALHVPGGRDDRSGSIGIIDPNVSLKLVDDAGKEVKPGERGELLVKGPNVCLGYWKNEKATQDAFDSEGYLRSGDIAVYNEEGCYWIVDRKKELIKVKGFQVAPAELEGVLLVNDSIADAAVAALQSEHDELPRAYVVLKDNAKGTLSEEDIQKWVAERVAKHKQLSGGVQFIDEVPRNPSGKILRKVLREWVKRDSVLYAEKYKTIQSKL